MSSSRTRAGAASATLAVAAVLLAACGSGSSPTQAEAGSGKGQITVWAHDGQPEENQAITKAVSDFNSRNTGVTVKLTLIPEKTYSQTITSTPTSQLPDIFEFDGPTMASDVYAGKLTPLDSLVSSATVQNQTSSVTAQNTYQGKRYAVSIIDSGLGIYGNKAMLDAAGIKYPTSWKDAWTADEFQKALAALAAKAPGKKSLDIQENTFPGEWGTYGFLPIVNSTGHVVVRDNTAQGNLNNPAVVAAITQFASWHKYVDPNTDGKAFSSGRVALSWVGHWMYPTYHKALGDKLIVLPLPDFGAGAKTGQGSWAWGISTNSKNGKAAGSFLDYLTSDPVVSAYTTADGAPPGTNSVMATSALYKPGGPLQLYAEALQHSCGDQTPNRSCFAVPRPVTPAYPVITQQFSTVIQNSLTGGNVKNLLDQATSAIDRAYKNNNNYS